MFTFSLDGQTVGVVGNAVGAPFAVLVAEEMFASGCQLLVSLTSAGKVASRKNLPRFLVIDRALRDEGTSSHYGATGRLCRLNPGLRSALAPATARSPLPLGFGTAWTTDAPFRETSSAIRTARALGADCVEMEAAALYAFSHARGKDVVCLAHVTNSMAQSAGDFEKGAENGSVDSLTLLEFVLRTLEDYRRVSGPTGNI